MNRQATLDAIRETNAPWDIVIIGGGATGLGTAVDAAARGYRTLLLEQSDFAKGTSSRSTKLVHGGVRYLKQGNISLVLEALRERGRLCQNANHLCRHQSFIIPLYHWWDGPFYGIGLKVYDAMAGKLGLQPSKVLSKEETLKRIPTLEEKDLKGGIIYYDGQFDDSRLAINLTQTLFNLDGFAINYCPVTQLLKENELVSGVIAEDQETGETLTIKSKVVINATGVFTDSIRQLDEPGTDPLLVASQGAHLVLPKSFLDSDTAIMIPKTSDGRVLFAVPWHDCTIVGTTDTPVDTISLEPKPLQDEINFILNNASQYLKRPPTAQDILSVFAGLRPLIKPSDSSNTASISRDHTLVVSQSGLLTITGGKWTTYRKMAEDTVDQAEIIGGFDHRACTTHSLAIHGAHSTTKTVPPSNPHQTFYGTDAAHLETLSKGNPDLSKPIHPQLPYLKNEVVWAANNEMARTVEDFLARRTRALLLNAQASIEAAPTVAALMAHALNKNDTWQKQSIEAYIAVAKRYLFNPLSA